MLQMIHDLCENHDACFLLTLQGTYAKVTAPEPFKPFDIGAAQEPRLEASQLHEEIKLTLFDVLAGTVSVTQEHRAPRGCARPCYHLIGALPTLGDQRLKTYTFLALPLLTADGGVESPHHTDHSYEFEVRAHAPDGAAQALCLSMVRVVTPDSYR